MSEYQVYFQKANFYFARSKISLGKLDLIRSVNFVMNAYNGLSFWQSWGLFLKNDPWQIYLPESKKNSLNLGKNNVGRFSLGERC